MNVVPKTRRISWIWLILAVFIAKELLWSYFTPPWQAPDEIAHYGYVESLFYEHAFPVLGQTLLSERVQAIGPVDAAKEIDYYKGSLNLNWIAQHPPLYYLGLEPLYALMPHEDPLTCIFLLRLVSILLGCVTLFYAHKTLNILLPDGSADEKKSGSTNRLIGQAVIVGMAFLPMFSSIIAAVNNDNLVIMLASVLTYLSVKNFHEHDTRGSLQMGIVLGLLALTKSTSLPLYLSIFLVEVLKHVRVKKYLRCFVKHQIIIFGTALAIAGWWYGRNIFLYGTLLPEIGSLASREPTLLQLYPNIAVAFPEAKGTVALPQAGWWDFFIKQGFLWEYYKNMWGAFGQFFFRLFVWQYVVIGVLTFLSVAGYIKFAFGSVREGVFQKRKLRHFVQKMAAWRGWPLLLPFLVVFAALTVKLFEIYRGRGFLGAMHGRYIFSALAAFLYFFLRGIEHLTPKKYLPLVLTVVMSFFVLNDFAALIYRIIPEFY